MRLKNRALLFIISLGAFGQIEASTFQNDSSHSVYITGGYSISRINFYSYFPEIVGNPFGLVPHNVTTISPGITLEIGAHEGSHAQYGFRMTSQGGSTATTRFWHTHFSIHNQLHLEINQKLAFGAGLGIGPLFFKETQLGQYEKFLALFYTYLNTTLSYKLTPRIISIIRFEYGTPAFRSKNPNKDSELMTDFNLLQSQTISIGLRYYLPQIKSPFRK